MCRWIPTLISLAALVLWAGHPATAQTEGVQVTVGQSDTFEAYLTDADGRALYLFTADQQGTEDAKATSKCYDACAAAWPPLVTDGEPQAGEQVQASLLGTLQRQDGAQQVTYNGWPLYYFARDQGPGQTTGQDVHGFGGEWYLVTPQGEKVEE